MTRETIYRELFNDFINHPKIDSHEHLLPQASYQGKDDILFSILEKSYLPWICFGARDLYTTTCQKIDLRQRISTVPASSFYRYLLKAFDFMYGFRGDLLDDAEWETLRLAIEKEYAREQTIDKWLRNRLSIRRIVWDPYWAVGEYEADQALFVPVLRIDPYFFGFSASARDHDGNTPYRPGEEKERDICTFDDYLALIDRRFAEGLQAGITSLKCAIAYDRGLDFPPVTRERARRAFEREDGKEEAGEINDFQNFIFHYFLEKAVERNLPIQIHTGPGKAFQGAAFRLGIVFEIYRSVKISLLHGGFPWVGEPGAMAHFYPNLFIDLAWLPLLSPTCADLALTQWIEATGGSRIMLGGDSWNAEGAVGSLLYNLECLSRVLTGFVERRYLSLPTARDIGHLILWGNPVEFFGERLGLP
ncbi:MAG TPA: amidohydrolase family protein [Atribacteraceae bacterium]|nr:amidohydrolase family protein [Atribacteraceae bacterium]